MDERTYAFRRELLALRREAAEAGDEYQVEICELALKGDEAAVAQCVYVIQRADDMLDDEED